MDKKLNEQLQKIVTGHRPRPLLGPFHGPHGNYYIRKRDLTYWQLKEKYPRKWWEKIFINPRHIFQKKHFRAAKPDHDHIYAYLAIFAGIVIYLAILIFYATKVL